MTLIAEGRIDNTHVRLSSLIAASGPSFQLLAIDEGSGLISTDEYFRRMFMIEGELFERVQEARKAKEDTLALLASEKAVSDWIKAIAPTLIPAGVGGSGGVYFEIVARTPPPPLPGLSLPGLNTLDYPSLLAAFDSVVASHGGRADLGLGSHGPFLEDGLPWFDVEFDGSGSVAKGKAFARALATRMNVRVMFNKIQADGRAWSVMGAFDFDPDDIEASSVSAYSKTAEAAEFIADYGVPILPPGARAPKPASPKARKPGA